MQYAHDDLRYARHGMTLQNDPPCRLIAYHAQQCVEKCLKAYLVLKNIDFPYTHNISLLLELCQPSASWVKEIQFADKLSPYAVSTRYPGEDDEVTRDEAEEAIAIAEKARDTISKALSSEGISLES